MSIDRLSRQFCLVKSEGFAHLVDLGLVSMMLYYVIGKTVTSIELMRMYRTDCSAQIRVA